MISKHPIDKLFEQKMAEYSSNPSPKLWEKIESRLPQKRKSYNSKYTLLLLCLFFIAGFVFFIFEKAQEQNPRANTQQEAIAIAEKSQKLASESQNIQKEEVLEKKEEIFEKNIPIQATPTSKKASSMQKAQKEANPEEDKEVNLEKIEKDTITKQSIQITDTTKTPENTKPKGTKIIIKLSEPELPKESKARDFASTKAGKFLKKAKKVKNGEADLPYFGIVLKN